MAMTALDVTVAKVRAWCWRPRQLRRVVGRLEAEMVRHLRLQVAGLPLCDNMAKLLKPGPSPSLV
jgi:hypothetical protein